MAASGGAATGSISHSPEKGAEKYRFPSVLFRDDDPVRGFTTLILTVTGLTYRKSCVTRKVETNAVVEVKFETDSVSVRIKLENEDVPFIYEKSLPDDIYPLKSKYKKKNGAVVLTLAKSKQNESWASHRQHFLHRSNPTTTGQ